MITETFCWHKKLGKFKFEKLKISNLHSNHLNNKMKLKLLFLNLICL